MPTATIPIGPFTIGVGTTVVGTVTATGMHAVQATVDLTALVTPVTLLVEYAADGLSFRDFARVVYVVPGTTGLEVSFGNDATGLPLTALAGSKVRLTVMTDTVVLSSGGTVGIA